MDIDLSASPVQPKRDKEEFLNALIESKNESVSVVPFNVALQSIDPRDANLAPDDYLYDSEGLLDEKPNDLTAHEFLKWRRAVLFASVVSILVQVVIAIISIVQGLKVDSSGTFGFGVETFLDVATTLIVIWRFSGSSGLVYSESKELKAVVILAVLMCLFSIGVIVKVIYGLLKDQWPFKELQLMIICSIGFTAFTVLSWVKLFLGQKIQSKAVIMDAISTFAATGMAMALLLSLLVYHFTNLWFLDSIVAIILCLLMFAYAARTLHKTRKRLLKLDSGYASWKKM